MYLDPTAAEVSARLIALLFARRTRRHYKRWLCIRSTSAKQEQTDEALIVRHPPLTGRRSAMPEADEPRRARNGCVLFVGKMLARLGAFNLPAERLKATCHVDGCGFRLTIRGRGAVNWPLPYAVLAHGQLAGKSLGVLGLTVECHSALEMTLHATSPEAIIQFSACLTRGETLDVPASHQSQLRALVALRDFDGDTAEMAARLNNLASSEAWLDKLPQLEAELPQADALDVAEWAYLPPAWATPEMLREFMARPAEEGREPASAAGHPAVKT
jgi:hypothetical protein